MNKDFVSFLKKNRSVHYGLAALSSAFFNFFIILYLGHILSPDQFGLVVVFNSVIVFLVPIVSFCSQGLIAINFTNFQSHEFEYFLRKLNSFFIISGFVIFFIFYSLNLLLSFNDDLYVIFIYCIVFSVIKNCNDLQNNKLIIISSSLKYFTFNFCYYLLSFAFILILHILIGGTYEVRLISLLIAEFLILMIRLKIGYHTIVISDLVKIPDKIFLLQLIKFGFPLLIGLFVSWLYSESDKFFILNNFDIKVLGYYGFVFSIAASINSLSVVLINIHLPNFFESLKLYKSNTASQVNDFTKKIMQIMIGFFIFLFFVYFLIYEIIPDKLAFYSFEVFLYLSIGFFFNSLYRPSGLCLEFFGKNLVKILILFISSVFGVSYSLIFISNQGAVAPAIGFSISNIFLFVLSYSYIYYFKCRTK